MTVRSSGCGTCISFWVFVTVLVTGNVKRLTLLDFHPDFRIKSGQDKIKTTSARQHTCRCTGASNYRTYSSSSCLVPRARIQGTDLNLVR